MRYLDVECTTADCPAGGRVRRVPVRLVALDVLDMPNLRCARCDCAMARKAEPVAVMRCESCTTLYAVGAPACPHCGSTAAHEEGTMPKITAHGGPSNAADPALATPAAPEVEPELEPAAEPEVAEAKPAKKITRGRARPAQD